MKPLYMWAGGKNKMISKYVLNPGIPLSEYDTYVEPFFGGGAMMIYMYENNPNIKRFVLNDINKEIVGLYRTIKTSVIEFIRILDGLCNQYLPLSKEDRKKFYYDTRTQYTTEYQGWSSDKESAVLYFLMKTAFNGIWQSTIAAKGRFCTPSGLLNQTNKVYDKDNVMEWHAFLQKVDIYDGDWKECIDHASDRTLYFFDPPYRDSFTQYAQIFSDQQHLELIDFCKKADQAGQLVMYCNREAGDTFYTDNKGQLEITEYDIIYTAGRRSTKTVKEEGKKEVNVREAKAAKEILLYSPAIAEMNCQVKAVPLSAKSLKSKPALIKNQLVTSDFKA